MSLFTGLFTNAGKSKPTVNGFSISTIDVVNATSLSVFYEFYERNPYIAAVIGQIQNDVGAHGYELRKGDTMNKNAQKEFKKLLKVSIGYTPRQFVKRIVRDYEVTGNVYVYTPRDGNRITGLQILDPRYMKPIMNSNGTILGYVQNLLGIRVFTVDEIFHLRGDTDLKYEALGRSKMTALFTDLETDKEARDSNLAFFRNNQTPASVIVLDPEYSLPTDAAEAAKVKKQLKEVLESGKYTGGKQRHRTSVWEGVKDVIKVQDKISDMEFINTRKFTLDMVCAVYEVPKDMLGITENSNRSVGDVQSESYYLRIEEKESMIDEFLSEIVAEIFGEGFSFVTMKDNIRTLVVRSKIAGQVFKDGLVTRNEAREIMQYEADTTDAGKEYAKSSTPTQDTQNQAGDTKTKNQ